MSTANVQRLLKNLRQCPVDSSGVTDQDLAILYAYLLGVPPKPGGQLHWFCSGAEETTREAAAFLIRLRSYAGENVEVWARKLNLCLSSCASCVQALEFFKVSTRSSYLAAFAVDLLDNFFEQFEQHELVVITADLKAAGFSPDSQGQDKSLSQLPPGFLYRLISTWRVFASPLIQDLFIKYPPEKVPDEWPANPVPPGALVLLLHSDERVRKWARSIASRSSLDKADAMVGAYPQALAIISHSLCPLTPALECPSALIESASTFPFAQQSELWTGIETALRLIPPEWVSKTPRYKLDLRPAILVHLKDQSPHFPIVFQCLQLLLKRLDDNLWTNNGPDPVLIYDLLRNKSCLLDLLQGNPGSVTFFREYLFTLKTHALYPAVFSGIIQFLFDQSNEEHWKDVQTLLVKAALALLSPEFESQEKKESGERMSFVLRMVETHAKAIMQVAYEDSPDATTRQTQARALISSILALDTKNVIETIEYLSDKFASIKAKTPIDEAKAPSLSLHENLWEQLQQRALKNQTALADLILIVSKSAHLVPLRASIYEKAAAPKFIMRLLDKLERSLKLFRYNFYETINDFTDNDISTTGKTLLQRPGVTDGTITLILSPVSDLRRAGESLVGLAFDVDGRPECFGALLDNCPDAALDGIISFLGVFTKYILLPLEACELSSHFLLCFSDILEVLCHGRLQSTAFLRPEDSTGPGARLLQFWRQMVGALSTVFEKVPKWSNYVPNENMVGWIRDAIILAREMLEQWTTFESAINMSPTVRPSAPGKVSRAGDELLQTFQLLLIFATQWLRITDEDILHQSYTLCMSLLTILKENKLRASDEVLTKFRTFADEPKRTRLDPTKIENLAVWADEAGIKSKKETERVKEVKVKPEVKVKQDKAKPVEIKAVPPKQVQQQRPLTSAFSTTTYKQTKLSTKGKLSEAEQRKLDAAHTIPSFRSSSSTSTSKIAPAPQLPRKPEPKKELAPSSSHSSNASDDDSESDDDSSDSDGPATGGLETLGKVKSPAKQKRAEHKGIKIIGFGDITLPRAHRVVQKKEISAREKAARLRPSVAGLHQALLSWTYDDTGPIPPGERLKLNHVPDLFDNYDHYFRVFEPLLLLECWSQLQQAKEEDQDSYACSVESKRFVDSFVDVSVSVKMPVKKDWYLAETDVVLISNPIHDKRIIAKVQSYKSGGQKIDAVLRVTSSKAEDYLRPHTEWQIKKLFSLSTLHREYGSLVSLRNNWDVCNSILKPALTIAPAASQREIKETQENFSVNEPQAAAIVKVLKTNGFSLIQGPPGTGKTSTICGLVGKFMAERPKPATSITVGQQFKGQNEPQQIQKARILLCAPSNAAIDEIAARLKDGYVGPNKRKVPLNIVRIGAESAIGSTTREISLETLVEEKLGNATAKDDGSEIEVVKKQLASIREQLVIMQGRLEMTNGQERIQLEQKNHELHGQRRSAAEKLNKLQDARKGAFRAMDASRRNARMEILTKADVVCCTLSGSGHESLEILDFDTIIIDEAAQAIEPSTLIPLRYQFTRCVMVGDPQQLPPTVISQEATRLGYNQSLFVRLQKSQAKAVHLLSIQYRMHPDISLLPSNLFYQGKLLDGPAMEEKTKRHWHSSRKFGTYRFFDVAHGAEESNGRSLKNTTECDMAVQLFAQLSQHKAGGFDFAAHTGIVSMYRAQIVELRRRFEKRFGKDIVGKLHFNTVDGFQGQEKDIIILSCVRGGPNVQKVGFLSDVRRMNVALTRAKSSLFILGNVKTLERSDDFWRQIVGDARKRSFLQQVDGGYFSRPDVSTQAPPAQRKDVEMAPPPPPVLMTPKLLAASQRPDSQRPDRPEASSSTRNPEPAPVPPPKDTQTRRPSGTKRHAETEIPAGPTTDLPAKQPPKKRPKPAPSLFIPKKHKNPS